MGGWHKLNQDIETCRRCPRLVKHCQHIAQTKRRAYLSDVYWGKPVPNLGPASAPLLIVGLAPGAHGANRTGRMFTGDRSGDWLFRALHKAGFCNQTRSTGRDDGLNLIRAAITAVCHCAPPANKPTREEIANCADFLHQTVRISRPRVFLALGSIAFDAMTRYALERNWIEGRRPKFSHGNIVDFCGLKSKKWLVGCYHPSQQNTFTGRLTEKMLDNLLADVRNLVDS